MNSKDDQKPGDAPIGAPDNEELANKQPVGKEDIMKNIVQQICVQLGCGPLALLPVSRIALVTGLGRKAVRARIAAGRLHRHPDYPHDWRCGVWEVARYLAQ